jgi:hypothetical protein
MEWKPRDSDIEWTRVHIAQLSEGGIWGIPIANSSTIQVFHSDKTYIATIHGPEPRTQTVMMQTMTVLKILGYQARAVINDTVGLRDKKFQEDNS